MATKKLDPSAAALLDALEKKVGFGVVNVSLTTGQLRIMGRVRQNSVPTWLLMMERLLVQGASAGWNVDLSKQYLMRGQKLLYGWRVIFQADNIVEHLKDITVVVSSVPIVRRQLDEVPLHASPNRNALRMGKGAQPTGKAVVGPMALRTLNTGG